MWCELVKKTSKKNLDMNNANVYITSEFYDYYPHPFERLEVVRKSHELTNICTDETLEEMGEETQEDREYNPNGYERYKFNYTPSTYNKPATIENVLVDLYGGFTGTTFAWRCKRYPHVMICAVWGLIFFGLLVLAPFCTSLWPLFAVFANTVSFMGPFSVAATIFQIWYNEFLKKKDLDTEYYSVGEDKWY